MKSSSQTSQSPAMITATKASNYSVTTSLPPPSIATSGVPDQNAVTTTANPSRGPDALFKVVAAGAAVSAVVFITTIVIIVVCCFKNRRKRTVNVNFKMKEIRTGGKHGLTYSLKRTFSDGPLYAVTNLRTSTTFPEPSKDRTKFRSQNYDKPDEYLTPFDGVPTQQCYDNGGYLQPMDGGRQLAPEMSMPTTVKQIIGQQQQQEQQQGELNEGCTGAVKIDQALYEEVTPTHS